jgi:dynactin 1
MKTAAARQSTVQPRQSLAVNRLSMTAKPSLRPDKVEPASRTVDAQLSPPVAEEDELATPISKVASDEEVEEGPARITSPRASASLTSPPSQASVPSRNGVVPPAEDRSRQTQVIKTLETKVRTLQKQRQEDQAQLQNLQDLEGKASRYEGIIQTLQKKLKLNQQEIQDLKAKYDDAESRASDLPNKFAEHESVLELATLDKEMAEERADMFESELEALKLKHEELELEAEILREENRELASVMSPEEKASAGWLQMERETERLRQALILLRDVSQQNEADLKNEIKELQESNDELEQVASKYEEAAIKLTKSEETTQHLREQLEAAEANDEILESMSAERDQSRSTIETLKRQVQDLEEHIQVADELESFHVEEEKRLHYQLDESEALLHDKFRHNAEQEKTIEDLEYTLTKFRDVVQGLQSDIDELRRSREISELEANEMSNKSRAMMDLNLRLQSSATKTQLKAIDLELGKMRAEQASLHLEIVQLFVPETFEPDKKPILALLCFKRIRSKAQLCRSILAERMRDRPELHDNPMEVFAVMERMNHIANLCGRFVQFMSTCSTEEFLRYAGAPFELEPVEQAMTSWVEALRRDELAHEKAEYLQRMADILVDMSEKLLSDSREYKAMELIASASMVENYSDNIAGQTQVLIKAVQNRLGSATDEDEESVTFERKMDQLGIKARTIKYISAKAMHALADLQSRSMCPNESIWTSFADAESKAEEISQLLRQVGTTLVQELSRVEIESPLSHSSIVQLMTDAISDKQTRDEDRNAAYSGDFFDIVSKQMQALQARMDDLNTKAGDISGASEFERQAAPWTVRAKTVKAQKAISQDLQEEMARLKLKIQEQTMRVSEKDKELEEAQVKVELLESRARDTKAKDDGVKQMKDEINKLRGENVTANESLQRLQAEHQTLLEAREREKAEIEAMRTKGVPDGQGLPLGPADESTSLRLKAQVDQLGLEIVSLQAAVRFLQNENHALRVPVGEVARTFAQHAWLDASHLKPKVADGHTKKLQADSKDVFANLIQLARTSKPVRIQPKSTAARGADGHLSTWRAQADTVTYQILQQKEELERWNEMKDDVVKRARIATRVARSSRPIARPQKVVEVPIEEMELGRVVDGVRVV